MNRCWTNRISHTRNINGDKQHKNKITHSARTDTVIKWHECSLVEHLNCTEHDCYYAVLKRCPPSYRQNRFVTAPFIWTFCFLFAPLLINQTIKRSSFIHRIADKRTDRWAAELAYNRPGGGNNSWKTGGPSASHTNAYHCRGARIPSTIVPHVAGPERLSFAWFIHMERSSHCGQPNRHTMYALFHVCMLLGLTGSRARSPSLGFGYNKYVWWNSQNEWIRHAGWMHSSSSSSGSGSSPARATTTTTIN